MGITNRSHPPGLRTTVKKFFKETGIKNSHIILGVSGGSDSMSLLHVLASLRSDFGLHISAVGIDHGLREAAKEELSTAKEYCDSISVPFFKRKITISDCGNLHENARNERYSIFREIKENIGADYIATAHHAEDLAETVLMRIIRGTTLKGLHTLLPVNDDVIRPMIRARKREVMMHIEKMKIPYHEDPSNAMVEKYRRSKVRHELIPLLQEMNPNIVQSLVNLSIEAGEI